MEKIYLSLHELLENNDTIKSVYNPYSPKRHGQLESSIDLAKLSATNYPERTDRGIKDVTERKPEGRKLAFEFGVDRLRTLAQAVFPAFQSMLYRSDLRVFKDLATVIVEVVRDSYKLVPAEDCPDKGSPNDFRNLGAKGELRALTLSPAMRIKMKNPRPFCEVSSSALVLAAQEWRIHCHGHRGDFG